jgi:myo-inositol-1(or 4)-monophosphatase
LVGPERALFDDIALMAQAAREGGALIAAAWNEPREVRSKGAAGPVTEVDLAVDRLLRGMLLAARPEYGWLSEETPDTDDRLSRRAVFVVDPIDGTRSFIDRVPECVVSIGLVVDGRAVAGVIFNPMTDEMFEGGVARPATRNGQAIQVTDRATLEGATLLGKPEFFKAPQWPKPWPNVIAKYRYPLAYRLAFVAEGGVDGGLLLGFKNEWDVAAGVAIVKAAGGIVTDPWGGPAIFNSPDPRLSGLVTAGPALHPLLCARVSHTSHPREWPKA